MALPADQKVSGRAGLLTFAGFLHWHQVGKLLGKVLPHRRKSKKAIPVADLALGFLAGILAGAEKLAQVAHLRGDVVPPVLLASSAWAVNVPSSVFQGFTSAGKNLATFRPLWRWIMERIGTLGGGLGQRYTEKEFSRNEFIASCLPLSPSPLLH